MCGIFGIVNKSTSKVSSAELEAAVETIRHRGPDSNGSWSSDNVGLAHVRLAIQDLSSSGHQPKHGGDEDRYTLVFNGEIYNHQEIREQLAPASYTSHSDTETLLHGLIQLGKDLLPKLNGIFAFAFYDRVTETLLLARDQLGVKPLYQINGPDRFVFASETKALLPYITTDTALNPVPIFHYLTYMYSPGSDTPHPDVTKVPPGSWVSVNLRSFEVATGRFYDLPLAAPVVKASEQDLVEELDRRLHSAVKRQLLSDVPVGSFLSGGLDSSLLVALACQILPSSRDLACYTAAVPEQNQSTDKDGFVSDLHFARLVATHLNVPLSEIAVRPDIVEELADITWHLDEPQSDPAPILVRQIAAAARKSGTVVLLSGAGGDDLFSGYRRHLATKLEPAFRITPSFVGKGVAKILATLSPENPHVRRIAKLARGAGMSTNLRLAEYFKWLESKEVSKLFTPTLQHELAGYDPSNYLIQTLPGQGNQGTPLQKLLYWDTLHFLTEHNLNYTDKAGMAEGVEIRVPYLDLELVSFASTIPDRLKLNGNEPKYLLKKVAERYLPHEVIYRPKAGFGAPVRNWITGDLKTWVDAELSERRIKAAGVFSTAAVDDLIRRNAAGQVDASYTILALVTFHQWFNRFVAQLPSPALVSATA